MSRDPYCSNCSYSLKGLTESSKCPECGLPLVEVLERGAFIRIGRRYTSKVHVFGLPLLSVAYGPTEKEQRGRAVGIIAMGDVAIGVLAVGGLARGVVAIGALAIGIVAVGSAALGLVALGGVSVGVLVAGGVALGLAAYGGVALAHTVASAGVACAQYARAGAASGTYVLSGTRVDQEAINYFREYAWLLGGPAGFQFIAWLLLLAFVIAAFTFLVVALGYLLRRKEQTA